MAAGQRRRSAEKIQVRNGRVLVCVWAAAAAAAGGGRKCRTEAFDCFAPAKAGAGRANSHTNRSVAGARAMVRCVTESATEEAELQSSHAIGGGGGDTFLSVSISFLMMVMV